MVVLNRSTMKKNDTTEILEAIGSLANQVQDLKLSGAETLEAVGLLADQMQDVHEDVQCLKTDVATLKTDVGGLKTKVTRIEANMVTKDYLDDKLADLHGDVVQFVKRRVPSWVE